MGKLVLFLSFISLFILIAGSLLMPNDPIMWIAGTSTGFVVLRVAVCLALIALLITNPPRNPVLRYLIGLFSSILIVSVLVLAYGDKLKFLDSLSLLSAGIAMAVTALEIDYEAQPEAKRNFAGHSKLKQQAAH